MIKVLMKPHLSELAGESGINRVIEGYFAHLPEFDIELVKPDATTYDLVAAHAGITGSDCDVCHTHGLYWTADYNAAEWEWRINARVIEAIRNARQVTVPSAWVAETFQRDMRFTPHIIPHGIDWQDWQHTEKNDGFVLWNKNRQFDVCDNSVLDILTSRFPNVKFVSTLPTPSLSNVPYESGMWPKNFKIIETGGKTPHEKMKRYIQRSGVYLSVAKETFGIGVLEAMASGKPVLGWNWGGNTQLVETGVNGYLAKPGDVDDLCKGLNYCLKHQKILGDNGRELARNWTWQKACEMVAGVYRLVLDEQKPTVSVIIPVYNKSPEEIRRAITSVLIQKPEEIIVVDDGSDNDIQGISAEFDVRYVRQGNQGVAIARNNGISLTTSKYICCLDADDWLEPTFLEVCIAELEKDQSLGIAYTALKSHNADGTSVVSQWPGPFEADKQLTYAKKQNQIPTACVFRREAWARVGGYKNRYCPDGAGSEDAAFWSAICSISYNARQVTEEALFNYSMQGGQVHSNSSYAEVDWLSMYPWAKDGQHPFASVATPKKWSHPVRQYDNPAISIIIPVGPGHEKEVTNALDSLEMQHFRKWEVIVVDDTNKEDVRDELLAYPYIKYIQAIDNGAGHARNLGVKVARAPLLLFLDADDILAEAGALNKMLDTWNLNEGIVYSDYLGKAVWDYEEAYKEFGNNLLQYHQKTQTAVFRKQAADYDPVLAQRQPELSNSAAMPYYHWCLISVLIPKAWHVEIGGFDETMETWEDVDYVWRLARAGKCFYRVPEPLVMYSYHKGYRRERGRDRQKHQKMIQYLKKKYKDLPIVGCNCGAKKQIPQINGTAASSMNDQDFVMIEFDFPGSGTRDHFGGPLISPTGQMDGIRKLDYKGYSRRKGERFLVHRLDQQARPSMFKLVSNEVKAPEVEKVPLPEPELIAPIKRRRKTTKK